MSPRFSALFLIGRVDDVHELLGFQSSTADEAAVDIGLGQQLSSVLGVHAAAILNGDAAGHAGTVQATDGSTDVGADLAGLLSSGGLAGADGPDGLIGDDAAAQFLSRDTVQSALDLQSDPLVGDAGFALLQALAHAMMGFMPAFSTAWTFLLTVWSVSQKY